MSKDLDLVVYGAGGYTGILVCQYILKVLMNGNEAKPKKDGQPVVQRWAIAGRRRAPLDAVMETLQKECNGNTALLPTVHVCSADELVDSPLTKDAKVLLSCAGPFATMGMHVLRACVKNKCHYVDVCGEPLFLRKAHAELHEEAKANGVTGVVCSGFDCVPAETAVTALLDDVQPMLKGQSSPVHEVHINTYLQTTDGLSSGTMHTLLNSIISTPSGKNKRDGADKKKGSNQPLLPDGRKPSRPPTKPGFVPGIGWAIPFPTADPHVVRLSETLRREGQGVLAGPRVVYQHWLVTSGFFSWLCVILGGAMLLLSARYAPSLTKRFMGWKFPERTGPSREALDNGGTTLTGQASVVEQWCQKKQTKKKKTVVSQYRVVTPHVYMATAPYAVNAAIWLLEQRGASSAIQHGILTPSTALKDAGADGASMSPRYFELIGSDLQQSKL